jgi:hypothetical protein
VFDFLRRAFRVRLYAHGQHRGTINEGGANGFDKWCYLELLFCCFFRIRTNDVLGGAVTKKSLLVEGASLPISALESIVVGEVLSVGQLEIR